MICSYGPYKITSSLEAVDEFTFIDNSSSRRVVVFADCVEASSPPCANATVLHIEDNCPGGCKILWYECSSEMGRQYSILPSPCGVKITSFEDGLIAVDNCDATLFGSELFCFGKVYTSLGIFDSSDKSLTTFEFDGHTFTVTGELGDCNELYNCSDCQISSQYVMAFESIPTPPDDFSAPEEPSEEEIISDIDTPETEVIPTEGRVEWKQDWTDDPTTIPIGQDTLCEDEKPLTSWPGGVPVDICESNDNPAIATLPSGHTIVAYENRQKNGLTKITVAILSSSVRKNIRSHRTLSTGTLLNNITKGEGIATFIVYEDMRIAANENGKPFSDEKIGFLTGPMAGTLSLITKITRIRDGDTIRHEFEFAASNVEFPDKNNAYDINWFITDDQGSKDLPNSSENITTILDLPHHVDKGGVEVPVSNPSIAVAQNNQMISQEQNVYVAYQAFEENEWRVYLREIVLGTEDAESIQSKLIPTYLAPYLFTNDVRKVETMAASPLVSTFVVPADTIPSITIESIFDDGGEGNPIDGILDWRSITGQEIPSWWWYEQQFDGSFQQLSYLTKPFILCSTGADTRIFPKTICQGGFPCFAVFNADRCDDVGKPQLDDGRDNPGVRARTRSFALFTQDLKEHGLPFGSPIPRSEVKLTMRFHIVINEGRTDSYPDLWFLIGQHTFLDMFEQQFTFKSFRIQIRRGTRLDTDVMIDAPDGHSLITRRCEGSLHCGSSSACFAISLFQDYYRKDGATGWFDRTLADGSQTDQPVRTRWVCVDNIGFAGDYSLDDWNEWEVDSYIRGYYRFFDMYLTHPDGTRVLMTQFREIEESVGILDNQNKIGVRGTGVFKIGGLHGFGASQSGTAKNQVLIDSFTIDFPGNPAKKLFFLENYFDRDSTLGHIGSDTDLSVNSPTMFNTPITTNADYDGAGINFCDFPEFFGDEFYDSTVIPRSTNTNVVLGPNCFSSQINDPPKGWAGYVGIRPPSTNKEFAGEGSSHLDAVSMIVSVNRNWRSHEGAYPHIWFVGRLSSFNINLAGSEWWSRYRLRISRFDAVSTYSSLGISSGDKMWRISAYNSGTGLATDAPVTENFLKIGVDTALDWAEYDTSGGGSDLNFQSVWNYFKIDLSDVDSSQVKFDIYVGSDRDPNTSNPALAQNIHPDDISFQLLKSITIPAIASGNDGNYFGLALFSGNKDESSEGLINLSTGLGDDYSSTAYLNYLALTTIGKVGQPVRGACCRETGGCSENILFEDCTSPDIWKKTRSCLETDCESEFIIGAGCTIDGECHDHITEDTAIIQNIGTCPNCEWQEGKDCSDRNCPDAVEDGRCCTIGSGCINNLTLAECQLFFGNGDINLNGVGFILGEACSSSPCLNSCNGFGACCRDSGCSVESEATCLAKNGTYQGNCTDCFSLPCAVVTGACCAADDSCTEETEADCVSSSIFHGLGTDCSPNPCAADPTIGACCFDDGVCNDTTEDICSGTWFSSSTCSDSPCAVVTGACCNSLGDCEDGVSKIDCQASGRDFFGGGSICAYVDCDDPIGACCVGLSCFGSKTLQECDALDGLYKGDFTNCIEGLCTDDLSDDPYLDIAINYKPEDLWIIETAPEQYITRVLYHMQEEIIVSSLHTQSTGNSTIDFMFLMDHSASMIEEINQVATAVSNLSANMVSKGFDVRFGFTFFGRGDQGIPSPNVTTPCLCGDGGSSPSDMANGLQLVVRCKDGNSDNLTDASNFVEDGFTRSADFLKRAVNCWGIQKGQTSPWSAIQFVIEDSQFVWRTDAAKFIFFITDTHDHEECTSCGTFSKNQNDAQNSLIENGVILIPTVNFNLEDDTGIGNTGYEAVAEASGWTGGSFDSNSDDYGNIFNIVIDVIDSGLRVDHATVIERAASGTAATYLKKGEVIITYDGDLSDLWTFNKTDFEFSDAHVPFPGTNTKQLVQFPFTLATGKVYGIDSVHIQGNPNNWVSFEKEGALLYDYPDVGHRASGFSVTPIFISSNSTRPKVYVNNRNQVMIAYENYTTGTPQIEIKGTGDFHQNSITGPKANRIVRMLNSDDFAYNHTITLPGEGANQLCDFVIDNSDITHVVWQSSRDGYWEIYYGNSFNMFDPVRITKTDSRSSHPSIDVDETGSIFVVYHDNRFGPFNILLSSKDEERVIPLLEQDAYLASLRTGYTHYTNIIPVFLDNPSGAAPKLGQFWATKKEDGAGNDSENFVYKISETTGTPSDGFDLASSGQEAIAFSSTSLWGIASNGVLSRLGQISDDNEVSFSPVAIGTIDLNIDGFSNSSILDMAVDKFDRIWILIHETEDGDNRLRIEYVSGFNASTVARGIVKDDIVDSSDGGSIVITSDNKFYITWENSPDITLSTSLYPDISEGVATFDFTDIGTLAPALTPVSMTTDTTDSLFVVGSDNDLYTVSKLNAVTTLQTSLTTGSGAEPSLPVGATSGITYQSLDVSKTGEEQFFHIRIDFYDNIAFEGDLFLSVDSRENLEAFINQESLDDPYAVIGMDARGIFLELDQIGIVFFDVTHFVPGFSRLSQPYSFEPNQTYFPRVFLISSTSAVRESGLAQPNSFSCSKCSRFGNNNFNTSACSYSFVMPNSDASTLSFNFQIDFYADTGKRHIIRRFEAFPGSSDLQFMEVDNKPAIDEWTEFGLPIVAGDSAFIQIHPVLDPTAGFLCGVTYTVQVNECHSSDQICSNFSKIAPSNWFSAPVGGGGGEQIQDILETEGAINNPERIIGLSMKMIREKLSIAWRTPDNNLKFTQFDGNAWDTQTVSSTDKTIYCDLAEINGLPSISHIRRRGSGNFPDTFEEVITLEGGSWNPWSSMNLFLGDVLLNPRTLIEYNNAPMIASVGTGIAGTGVTGQPFFKVNGQSAVIFESDPACTPVGSCIITLATINGLPAAAYISLNQVRYAKWNTDTDILNFESVVNQGDATNPLLGKVALAEVNGQPAVAYIKSESGGGQLKYKRFDGTNWVNTSTNGQIRDFNKHLAMNIINGQPYIVYSVKTSSTTSQLRYAFNNGVKFIDDVIDDDLNVVDPVVDIIEYNNEPAVIISSNPFKVYFFRQQPTDSVNELRPVYFCECSSRIFTNRLTHLNEVSRWESSAHGFADTPVTDSSKDSLRPIMKTRKTGAAIVIWEDYNKSNNCTSPPCIRAATFRNVNQDQLRGSGTKSWFDYDFGILGQDPDLTLDIFERINLVYEKPKPSSPAGLHGRQIDTDELPGNELYGKVCDFSITTERAPDDPSDPGGCDLSAIENNVISFDKFISNQIVRKILVKNEFVQYYTYNASGTLSPIVSTCNLTLEIHGTPEIVALRLRNENKSVWGPWCPWSPQISDFVMEKKHQISGGSGIKEVCIQAMTYVGITTEFCLPIIADYETVVFETRFYKNTDTEGVKITNFSEVNNEFFPVGLDEKLVKLPLSDGVSIASLAPENGVISNKITVLVEIIPNQEFSEPIINFDVVQQGTNDTRGIEAFKGKNNEGKVLYRGDFVVGKEDKVFNIDGLARVNPTFPSACENAGNKTVSASAVYTRDTFNEIGEDIEVEITEVTDPLAEFRQTISGRVGVSLDIRSSEDPYFVFGDPDYSLKKEDGRRLGVPFKIVETEISVGEAPDQNPCVEEECPDGGVWDPVACQCLRPGG